MDKYLILFFGTDNPGPYINALSYSIEKCNIDHVIFIDLINSSLDLKIGFADFLDSNLRKTLIDLTNNNYDNQPLSLPKGFTVYKDVKKVFDKFSNRGEFDY